MPTCPTNGRPGDQPRARSQPDAGVPGDGRLPQSGLADPTPEVRADGHPRVEISHEKGWSKFDLLLGMSERTTGLNTTWEYSTELFNDPTVQRMMSTSARSPRAPGRPDRRLSRLSMLSDRGAHGGGFLERAPRFHSDETIKELFEEQCGRPDGPASSRARSDSPTTS